MEAGGTNQVMVTDAQGSLLITVTLSQWVSWSAPGCMLYLVCIHGPPSLYLVICQRICRKQFQNLPGCFLTVVSKMHVSFSKFVAVFLKIYFHIYVHVYFITAYRAISAMWCLLNMIFKLFTSAQ